MKISRIAQHNSTPAALQSWLENELEKRGIDANIYTRYVLSLLQDDSDSDEYDCTSKSRKGNAIDRIKPSTSVKRRHKRYANAEFVINDSKSGGTSAEERKLAAVDCLKSASENDFGIESLVEELCEKLKRLRDQQLSEEDGEERSVVYNESYESKSESPKERAQKYYAAFPALESGFSKSTNISKVKEMKKPVGNSEWNGKKIIEVTRNVSTPTHQMETNIKGNEVQNALADNGNGTPTGSDDFGNEKENDNINLTNENSYKELCDKIDKIESIWKNDSCQLYAYREPENIWTYDITFDSPQSSGGVSPILHNAKKIWKSTYENEKLFGIKTPIWKGLTCLDWDRGEPFGEVNKTTLSNHKEDSLFVEVMANEKENQHNLGSSSINQLSSTFISCNSFDPSLENLFTSPKTHFQPIKQDSVEREESDSGSINEADTEVANLVVCSSHCPNNIENLDKKPLLSKQRPISTSFEELEYLCGPFTEGDALYDANIADLEKNAVTDKSTNTDNDVNIDVLTQDLQLFDANEREPEFDLCNMLKGLLKDTGDSDAVLSLENQEQGKFWNCFAESETIADNPKESYNPSWSFKQDSFPTENNLQCTQLEALQNEIKNEEDEIFSDIKNMGEKIKLECSMDQNKGNYICSENLVDNYVWANDHDDSYNKQWCVVEDYLNETEDPLLSENFSVQYSCDLENSWQAETLHIGQRQPQRLEKVTEKKPCTFFMEGNCRRFDCKFSHDLSNITCRFWEEGGCFKGEMCPFLHGYPNDSNGNEGVDETEKFAIESESDFPTLSGLSFGNSVSKPKETCYPLIISEKQSKKKRRKGGQASS